MNFRILSLIRKPLKKLLGGLCLPYAIRIPLSIIDHQSCTDDKY